MTALPPTPAAITATCRDYFGRAVTVRGRKDLVGNRCDHCPLRSPCLKHGAFQPRTIEDLAESKRIFVEVSTAVLRG